MKMPAVVECRQCGHQMLTADYVMNNWPGADIPAQRIHHSWSPMEPMYSVMCPNCAHFTMNKPIEGSGL